MDAEQSPQTPLAALVHGVRKGDRRALARAITLIESSRYGDQTRAAEMVETLLPHSGRSIRMGITGAPGSGKSTLIEALGLLLIEKGHRVAVLAVDPTSAVSGGSILGDKTRMERLSVAPGSFIRPSPSRGSLGGVAEKTREALLVCEAAGFDVLIVETVGVGQSETTVAGMVDAFVLLQTPNTGDDLQAIKKGVVELADIVLINKADLDPVAADRARQQIEGAIAMLRPSSTSWRPPVLTLSARTGAGVEAVWETVRRFHEALTVSGELTARRHRQAVDWFWSLVETGLRTRFRAHPRVRGLLEPLKTAVSTGTVTPAAAATRLLAEWDTDRPEIP